MSGPEIQLSKQEHMAMIECAEQAEQRAAELRQELIRYQRALDRWRGRAFRAESAITRALRLIEPIAKIHERIEQISYGGPPSPLLAVRSEAEKASQAYTILEEARQRIHGRRDTEG